jgi:hypothetical protein
VRRIALAVLVVVAVLVASSPVAAGEPVWGKDLVAGKEFPMPFGIGVTYFSQDQDYVVDRLEIGVPGFPMIPAEFLGVKNELDEVNVKFDAWLLPYLNVFGILGEVDGKTRVDLSRIPIPLGLPFTSIDVSYDGEVYGFGVVLAGGGERFFGSLTGIVTETSLSGNFDSAVDATVITPRVGVHGSRGAFFVGGMYLDAQEKHSGTVMIPFLGAVPFAVELSQKEDWNYLAGVSLALGARWTLEMEGGFGDREHANAALTYRF